MMNTIIQVLPADDYKVYLYFVNGEVRLFDAIELVGNGVLRIKKYLLRDVLF